MRAARIVVIALLAFFTLSLAFGKSSWVFLDNVNLLLHEAGHVLFRPFGETGAALGGTLSQLLWPTAFGVYFLWRRKDVFAALACAWWLGENLQNVARYMRDAIDMGLPLVGGEVHDWNYLFTRWGVLRKCLEIGGAVRALGWALMLGALAWMIWLAIRPTREDLERFDSHGP